MRTERASTLIIMLLALVLSLPGLTVLAGDNNLSGNVQTARDQIRADKKALIEEAMELTESEAKAFWPIYENYQKDLVEPTNRAVKLIKEYAENYQSMTNGIARRLTDEFLAVQAEQQKLREVYLPQFRRVLPDIKVGRYYQVEHQISALVNFELAAKIPLMK